MKKKLLIVLSLMLILTALMSLVSFAQGESPCQGCEVCNPTQEGVNDEMPPMKIKIDGEAFLHSLVLMGKGMLGIFIVTLVIIGVVAILNWHGKSMADRNAKK